MIRTATPQDAKAIAAIWNPFIRDTLATFNSVELSIEDVRAKIDATTRDGFAFLVSETDEIDGFAYYGQFRGGVGYAHALEHTLYVRPMAAKTGVGRGLLRTLETHAHRSGGHMMQAGVSAENAAALGFHAAMGYEAVARLKEVGRKFDRWLDLVLMQKELKG